MRIALHQGTALPGDPTAAIAAVRVAALVAAAEGAGLIAFPELFLDGGEPTTGEASDGPHAAALRAIAREAGLAIVTGYAERCTGRLFNAAVLIDAAGVCIANYRKTHLHDDEPAGFAPGQWLTVMPVAGRRVGLLVGADLAAPEMARSLVLAGTDLLVALAMPGSANRKAGLLTAPARAMENHCAVLFATYAGPGQGGSRIIGPEGDVLVDAGDSVATLVAELPRPALDRERLLSRRRPNLYRELVVDTAL